jgi:hypothetical protein
MTYRGFYLTKSGRRRSECVVKLGYRDSILREYQGWQEFIRRHPVRGAFATMTPPVKAEFGAIVIIDLVGSEETPFRSLASAMRDDFPLLTDVMEQLVNGTLAPLHEFCREPEGPVPTISLNQGELLSNWLMPDIIKRAQEQMASDTLLTEAGGDSSVRDSERLLELPNALSELLRGEALPTDGEPALLPLGAVHGDPNFDNVFFACVEAPPTLKGLALIDFEWCGCGPPDSPFDDFSRIESELLFGRPVPYRRDLLQELALGDPWLESGRPLSASMPPAQQVFEAIRIVRSRGACLARLTEGDLEGFARGYLATLLGQAVRSVGYPNVAPDIRADALYFCQLLAARLALPLAESPAVRVSIPPRLHGIDGGKGSLVEDAYLLDAGGEGYASLILSDLYPAGDFTSTVRLRIERIGERGWLAIGLGVDPDLPQRSGLSAMLSSLGTGHYSAMIHSHRNSKHRAPPRRFQVEGEVGLALDLSLEGGYLNFSVGDFAGRNLSEVGVRFPAEDYLGPLALVAHSAKVEVDCFRVELADDDRQPGV